MCASKTALKMAAITCKAGLALLLPSQKQGRKAALATCEPIVATDYIDSTGRSALACIVRLS